MGITQYLAAYLQDCFVGSGTLSKPATVYLAAFTVTPSAAGGGTEVSGNNYSRKAITVNGTNFPNTVSGTGVKTLGGPFAFPTASGAWGTVVAWALMDASTAGNMLWWGLLPTSRAPLTGDTLTLDAGALSLTLTAP